jgi:hypoxanthine phosphoribosyltransferase
MSDEVNKATNKIYVSYNQLHDIIRQTVQRTKLIEKFSPTLLIAISAGGFLPTRILRNIIKSEIGGKSLPIQTIGLCLYESEKHEIYKTQWISTDQQNDPLAISFNGQHILIIDEVDETRTTLSYAVKELKKDIEKQRNLVEEKNQEWIEPKLGVFVVHNKMVTKHGNLPEDLMKDSYFVGENVSGEWIVYPWDALDIDEHTLLAENRNKTNKLTLPSDGND